jgi:2-keto-3-deoxy-L-rhamnonate aldolase RhmA
MYSKALEKNIKLFLFRYISWASRSPGWTTRQKRAIVQEAKYPPIGHRGISGMGPHTGYKGYGTTYHTAYSPWAKENIILCPSIESLEGLENVEAIAAVEGIDMLAHGHSDLSAALGIHLQLDHPRFKEVVRHRRDLREAR